MPGKPSRSPQVEAMLRELSELWEDLQRKHQENGIVLREIDKVHGGRAGVSTGHAPAAAACWGSASKVLIRTRAAALALTSPDGITASTAPPKLPVPWVPTVGWHGLCLPWVAQSQADGFPTLPQALRVVEELDQAERWLQAVAGSLSEPAAMKSPVELRQDLEEMGQLERQLVLCGIKLQALREEAADESPTEHEGARKMQRKVEMVEEK